MHCFVIYFSNGGKILFASEFFASPLRPQFAEQEIDEQLDGSLMLTETQVEVTNNPVKGVSKDDVAIVRLTTGASRKHTYIILTPLNPTFMY